ncbi:RNA polymerase sigma factor [Planosporangium sp. 12N6]|uniref:RNA polymerase sigma factor n=1 Tax=Planosporangium spinosum TaxID=3402278 RepID=UPI003CE8E0D9
MTRGEYGQTLDTVACGPQITGPDHVHRAGDAHRPDSDDLIASAQGGDEYAFRLLYREVQPRLLRYLHALVPDDAEDVAADVWLEITRGLHAFQGGLDGFRGWAATIARHRALDHLRRLRRRPSADVPVEELVHLASTDDTAGGALDAMSTGNAVALIASLPRDQAEAVMLRAVMGLSAEAAAKVLGKRSGAVRIATHRGLRRLAERVGRAGEPAPRARLTAVELRKR